MFPSQTPVSGSSATTPSSVERRDRETDEDKKDKLREFVKGLSDKDKAKSDPARAAAAASAQPRKKGDLETPQSPAKAAKGAAPDKTDKAEKADAKQDAKKVEGADAKAEGAEGAEAESAESTPSLLDGMARRAVTLAARKALRQRVVNPGVQVKSPDPVEPQKVAREAAAQVRAFKEKKARETTVEEAKHDPQAAVASQQMSSGAVAHQIAAKAVESLPAGHPIDPATFRQMVEFANVHKDRAGVIEFQLGLQRNVLGGAQIVMRAYGERKIGLKVKNGGEQVVSKEDLESLVRALKSRDLDVVEVEVV